MMRKLFAEAFTVPLLDSPAAEPELRFDESRQLNVTVDGQPFIEFGAVGRTDTLTEVRAEQDDFDRPEPDGGDDVAQHLHTTTKVRREADDFARAAPLFGTETRQAPGERDDFARGEMALGTETAIDREADDFARAALSGTKTSVRPEADDFVEKLDDDTGRGVVELG